MPMKNGADMGYRTQYVVDCPSPLRASSAPSEVMDNQPMLDLLWRVRFRWNLWLRQVLKFTSKKEFSNITMCQ